MFWQTFWPTLGCIGLGLAAIALLIAIARLAQPSKEQEMLGQSPREKTLRLENIQLRRHIAWLEPRIVVGRSSFANAPTGAPSDPTEKQSIASSHE